MMSRLALYPIAAAFILFSGRKGIGKNQLILGSIFVFLPIISLLWSVSPTGGIPFAVRWSSFGLMVMGFSGSVNSHGLKTHLPGLAGAAAVTSLLVIILGPDAVTGNANRAGMILALGFTGSLYLIKNRLSLLLPLVILSGAVLTSFYICWIACFAGSVGYLLQKSSRFNWRIVLFLMVGGQITVSAFPSYAGRIGPTLEIRTRIWNNSARLFSEHFPLGTGFGTARLTLFSSSEPELRILSGTNTRVDYVHSEPLTLITETGIAGLLSVVFLLCMMLRSRGTPEVPALALAFWPVFTADLPLATPLGALPAALFLGMLSSSREKQVNLPAVVPVVLLAGAIFWGFFTLTGYGLLAEHMETGSSETIEEACKRIPFEERAFLAAGYSHLAQGNVLAAMEDSRQFILLYPEHSRGWELHAVTLSAAGRSNSSSAWARAALLIPDETYRPDRYLILLNGIDTGGMNPDTALMLSSKLNSVFQERVNIINSMSSEEKFSAASKLLYLCSICRERGNEFLSAGIWLQALKLAVSTDTLIPAEISIGILHNIELKELLKADVRVKAEEHLLMLEDRLGVGTE